MKLKGFIHRMHNLGIPEGDESLFARQTRFVNQVSFFCILPIILHTIAFYFTGEMLLFWIAIGIFVSMSLVLFLNHIRQYKLARNWVLLMSNSAVLILATLVGAKSGIQYYCMFVFCFAFILIFDGIQSWGYRVFQAYSIVIVLGVEFNWLSIEPIVQLPPVFLNIIRPLCLAFSCFASLWVVRSLYQGNIRAEKFLEEVYLKNEEEREQAFRSSRMASLGQMAGGLAHEINTPLFLINGKVGLIREMIRRDPPMLERARGEILQIEGAVTRVSKVIRGMLSFSGIHLSADRGTQKVGDLIEDVLALCAGRIREDEIRVSSESKTQAEIGAEMGELAQILVNLIQNSCDAIAPLRDRWIKVQSEQIGDQIQVSITDSGKGIPSEIAHKMMEPFFTTKPVGKGTGLGLSVSRELARKHGGDLVLDRESSHTRFVVLFPAVKPEARSV